MTRLAHAAFPLLLAALPVLAAVGGKPAAPPTPATPPENAAPSAPAMPAPAPARGQLLYENHCLGCHESRLHIREQRRATSPAALRAAVVRWAINAGLGWGEDEIDEVTGYLNERYYRFPAPVRQ